MTKSDHVLAVFKATISAVPGAGGPIASLISDYIPTATQRSIRQAIELFGERLQEVQERIDVEAVNKDEFAELFKSCVRIIGSTHREEKLRACARLLANSVLRSGDPEKLTFTELDHFVGSLDSLSTGAIAALGEVDRLVRIGGENVREIRRLGFKTRIVLIERVAQRMGLENRSLLRGLLSELHALHLVVIVSTPERIPLQGNLLQDAVRTTSLGRRFVSHLL